MVPEYKYQVIDNSLVTPYFKKWIVKPFIRIVPWGIPANFITIASNLFMYAALVLALFEFLPIRIRFVISAILILFYAIGDHLDGMQAKRTHTSSALGEFFDHFLDVFNTGILLIIMMALFGVTNPVLIILILLVAYLAHAGLLYEQFKTGWLRFDKIGSLEAVLTACLLLLISSINPVYEFFISVSTGNFKNIEILFVVMSLGSLVTFIRTSFRARIKEFRFFLFCFLLTAITFICTVMFGNLTSFFIIIFYAGLYMGNLIRGHLADGIERLPDLVIPVILLAGFFLKITGNTAFIVLIFSYFLLATILIVYHTIAALKKYWVWKNPSLAAS